MEKNEMDKLIDEELERIPRGHSGSGQNELRNFYAMRRKNCLKDNPRQSPAEAFHKAVEDVRKNDPDFSPSVTDPSYFEWQSK